MIPPRELYQDYHYWIIKNWHSKHLLEENLSSLCLVFGSLKVCRKSQHLLRSFVENLLIHRYLDLVSLLNQYSLQTSRN